MLHDERTMITTEAVPVECVRLRSRVVDTKTSVSADPAKE